MASQTSQLLNESAAAKPSPYAGKNPALLRTTIKLIKETPWIDAKCVTKSLSFDMAMIFGQITRVDRYTNDRFVFTMTDYSGESIKVFTHDIKELLAARKELETFDKYNHYLLESKPTSKLSSIELATDAMLRAGKRCSESLVRNHSEYGYGDFVLISGRITMYKDAMNMFSDHIQQMPESFIDEWKAMVHYDCEHPYGALHNTLNL